MSDFDDAVARLTAWVRNYGDAKPRVFIGDVMMVLLAARDTERLTQELAAVRESVRTLLRDARRWSDSEWYLIVGAEAYEAARAAGGPT